MNYTSVEQIVVGEVEPFSNEDPILVICDNWPSLAFALCLKGYSNVTARVSSEVQTLLTSLKRDSRNDDIIDFNFIDDSDSWPVCCGDRRDATLFIQGNEAFVNKNLTRYAGTVKRIISLSNATHRGASGLMVTHGNMGGVTNGRYQVNLHNCNKLKGGWNKLGLTRRLKNILKSTEKGITVGNVDNYINHRKRKRNCAEMKVVNPNMKINTNTSQIEVVAPCVLNRSGWVRRMVTKEELLDAYDINTEILSVIASSSDAETLLSYITHSAPGKVCEGLVSAFTTAHHSQNITNTVGSFMNEKRDEGIQWMVDENEGLINDANAKRGDDWETDVSQWNKYIVTEFKSDVEWHDFEACNQEYCSDNNIDIDSFKSRTVGPMICKGEVSEAHLNLFAGLRRLMLRKYRRNLTKSFSTYAKKRYGENWTDELKGRGKLFELLSKPKNNISNNKKRKRGYDREQKHTLMSSSLVKDLHIDVEVASEGIRRVCDFDDGGSGDETNWWDWSGGSTLFFWRWHPFMNREARSGTPVWRTGAFAPYRKRQTWPKNPDHKTKMISKLVKVVRRGYIQTGQICSLTGFFAVPKGENDIRMVYDATKCGLNDTIWAPTFLLPTIDTTLRQVDIGGFMSDIDLGEMFLNFPLDDKLKKYAGVDLTELRQELIDIGIDVDSEFGKNRIFLRWTRCLMGLRSSPYTAVRYFAWIEEFIRGSRSDKGNVFRFDQVRLNLPGMSCYDPSLPPVGKILNVGQGLVPNFSVYIDDIRICGGTLRDVVKAARRIASRCNYMGIQDAPRKRRFPSRAPGVWSGAKSISTSSGLYTCTTQAKWERGKNILLEWEREYKENNGKLNRKDMEKGRGFLVHLARTYPIMVSNLKGIHHAIESWRSGRDGNGWKISNNEWRLFLEEISERESDDVDHFDWHEEKKAYLAKHDKDAPAIVDASKVKRFSDDLNELLNLMRAEKPPRRLVRGKNVVLVKYGFGDASGCGFGASWESDKGISFRMGIWSEEVNKDKSSNFRELKNLVETLELMGKNDELNGVEIFFFTDNSTAERAFYKGSSSSKLLHELVSRLKNLEMYVGCKIYLCHVSGKRMIAQGTDGLSRGNTAEGVMKKGNMLEFIPLHLTALERSSSLLNWLRLLCEGHDEKERKLEILDPLDWYERGHDHLGNIQNMDGLWMPKIQSGLFLWHPAPAAAETALEELRMARLKRTKSTHVFVCPRLLEPQWRSHLHKSADLVLEIPAGTSFWPEDMFEPLIIGLYFPYLSHRPWELRHSPSLVELGRRLRPLWKTDEKSAGIILREFWSKERSFSNLSPKLVFKMLHSFQALELSHP